MAAEAERRRPGAQKGLNCDVLFKGMTASFALSILCILLLMLFEMLHQSLPSLHKFGSSILALLLATPLSVGSALFITEILPKAFGGAVGNTPQISLSLLSPAYTMPSVIANEFAETMESRSISMVQVGARTIGPVPYSLQKSLEIAFDHPCSGCYGC